MTRKAEFAGQIIIFVLGLVVVAGILFFGYTVIQNTVDSQCDVDRVRFGTQLQERIDRNKGYGSNRAITMDAPCKVQAICFIDRQTIDDETLLGEDTTLELSGDYTPNSGAINVMHSSVTGQTAANVFFIDEQGFALPVQRFSAQSAAVSVGASGSLQNTFCVGEVGAQFRVRLQGTGQTTRVGGVE